MDYDLSQFKPFPIEYFIGRPWEELSKEEKIKIQAESFGHSYIVENNLKRTPEAIKEAIEYGNKKAEECWRKGLL